jgi:hypothetical protein
MAIAPSQTPKDEDAAVMAAQTGSTRLSTAGAVSMSAAAVRACTEKLASSWAGRSVRTAPEAAASATSLEERPRSR